MSFKQRQVKCFLNELRCPQHSGQKAVEKYLQEIQHIPFHMSQWWRPFGSLWCLLRSSGG